MTLFYNLFMERPSYSTVLDAKTWLSEVHV